MNESQNHTNTKLILVASLVLALFALLSILPVSSLQSLTRHKIEANLQAARLQSVTAVLDGIPFDNDILSDQVDEIPTSGDINITSMYIARQQGLTVATVFEAITRKGYNGKIRLIVGISSSAELTGVRILEHQETPGLGDAIAITHSDWLLGFEKKSLGNPSINHWSVKKDGGDFDQLTGATISPRAVVNAVKQILIVYNENRDLFTDDTKATHD